MWEYYKKGTDLLKEINVEPEYIEPLLELSAVLMERENQDYDRYAYSYISSGI